MVEYSEKEIAFHRKRIMFCVHDGKVEVSKLDDPRSHIQWFKDEGWDGGDEALFLVKTTRGMFYPTTNSLYCYTGYHHTFDLNTIWAIKNHIQQLKFALNLNAETKINFGPMDEFFEGITHKRYPWGTLSELERRVNIQNFI